MKENKKVQEEGGNGLLIIYFAVVTSRDASVMRRTKDRRTSAGAARPA